MVQCACAARCSPFHMLTIIPHIRYVWAERSSLLNMMFLLDHPGFIDRSLSNTQIKDKGSRTFSTDFEKWKKFSHIYAEDTSRLNLLVGSRTSSITQGRY